MIIRLHRAFAPRVARWVARCAAEGIDVVITQGWRPVAYQQELLDCWNDPTRDEHGPYACRRRRGIVVKPAKPGSSFHNCAKAIDAVIIPVEKLGRAVQLAEEEGLFWGGRLRTPDSVHWDDGPPDHREQAVVEAMRTFTEADLIDFETIPIIAGIPIHTHGH